MQEIPFKTPIDCLLSGLQKHPDDVYLTQPIADEVHTYTWRQVHAEVAAMAGHLSQYPRGSHIGIFSLNCAHWIMADLAIQMAGHISIPIYPTASANTVNQILEHSGACALFIGKMFEPEQSHRALPADLDVVSIYQPYEGRPHWDELVAETDFLPEPVPKQADDLISIAYTSGTTGQPKGVMVTYGAVSAAMNLIRSIIVIDRNDRFVSYLPLAHVAERMAVEFGSLFNGSHVSFIRSLETFTEDIQAARPTIFFGVPRIWAKIKMAVEEKAGGLLKLLSVPVLGGVLKKKLRQKLGMDTVRFALCAAAPVNVDVLKWYARLGIKVNEAYGMSETCGLSHMGRNDQDCVGTVGQVIPGCECRLSDNGEILLRNPAVMVGYYKQPELTAQTIDAQGWLHTGDLGEVDEDGFLKITGRVKDIFKTAKGKYIAPLPIESAFQSSLGVDHVILMGEGLAQPFILLTTHEVNAAGDEVAFSHRCQDAIDVVNAGLEPHEKVSHVIITDDVWDTENGFLTPTLKVKRAELEKHYQPMAETAMNKQSDQVIKL